MTFTGFPYTKICFRSARGKGAGACPSTPGGTIDMFRLFERAFAGKWAPQFTARKCVKEETASPSGPLFQQNGTNEHARARTIALVAAACSPRPAAFPHRPRQDG